MRVLLLEDDCILGEALRDFIRMDAHVVEWCTRLAQARSCYAPALFDALLIDWNLPDGSGLEWLKMLRNQHDHTPAIVITAKDDLADRLTGLNTGADDYLVKPFEPEELVARLRAVCRRASGHSDSLVQLGDVSLSLLSRSVCLAGHPVELTAREWSLIEALALRQGRTVTKPELEDLVMGFDGSISFNALEVHVSSIRKKLGRDVIHTVRGLGYRIGK